VRTGPLAVGVVVAVAVGETTLPEPPLQPATPAPDTITIPPTKLRREL
jgi:hypothetical protein